MAIPYTQPSMALVRAVDGTFISYPFIESGDTTTKVYNLVCTQRASDYNAAQIALDDNMSSAVNAGVIDLPSGWADSNAYFVGDTGHAPIAGGMISFTRTFANIPQSTNIASGSEFVTFPGISGTYTSYTKRVITSLSMTAGVPGITFTTGTNHNFSSLENVVVNASYVVANDPFIHHVNGNFSVIENTLTTFRIDPGHYWQEQVSLLPITRGLASPNTCYRSPLIRQPLSRNIATQTRYDYILPGVTSGISDVTDINVPQAFSVTDVLTGYQTDTAKPTFAGTAYDEGPPEVLAVPATETIPTAEEYANIIEQQYNIVVESSLSEWAGNILVMKTKTCKAQ